MDIYIFESLNLQLNEMFFMIDAGGQLLQGEYKGEHNPGDDTFDFHNYGTGKTSTVSIDSLQQAFRE